MKRTICISAGHGGRDCGAVNPVTGRREADDNLCFAASVAALLQRQGHCVLLPRQADVLVSSVDRRLAALQGGAELFIDLHRASGAAECDRGVGVFVRNPDHLPAASEVLAQLAAAGGLHNRGIKVRTCDILRDLPMPAMVLELGSITCERENDLLDRHIDEYAKAAARGIVAALGERYREADKPASGPLYRVQVGAFGRRSGAEGFLSEAQNQGLPAFLVEFERQELYKVQVGAFPSYKKALAYHHAVKDMGLEASLVLPAS